LPRLSARMPGRMSRPDGGPRRFCTEARGERASLSGQEYKEWDWIDCVSFELMERRGLREALSLDHHFAQAGFILLV
jgi:predicted nucleic acid-binding protein